MRPLALKMFSLLTELSSPLKSNARVCSSYNHNSKWYSRHSGGRNKSAKYFSVGTGLGLALGLTISHGFYKYLQSDGRLQEFVVSSSSNVLKMPKLHAATVTNSGDSSSSPPRNKFNFLADVVEKTSPAVVYIEIKAWSPVYGRLTAISNGSGFIIKSDGLILTNAHVVANKPKVTVKLHDGREFEGMVEDRDPETDLATVRIKADNLPVLPLGQSSKLRPGEFVIAMGNPLTLSHTITAGVISSALRPSKELGLHQKTDYIQTDAAINVGNSGGPLVNLDGEAIGINTMKVTEGISFAIPSDKAVEFLERAKKNRGFRGPKKESGQRKYIGITMLSLSPSLIEEMQIRNPDFPKVQHGVLVWRVLIQSPAYDGGLRPGDVITEINGVKIYSASDVYKIIDKNEVLKLGAARGSIKLNLTVTPQESIN